MIAKHWKIAFYSLTLALSALAKKEAHAATLNYESYIESWDSNWQNIVTNLPPGPGGTTSTAYAGVTLNVGFACFNFTSPSSPLPNGLQFTNGNLGTVVTTVHSKTGKARISFGGASYAAPCAPRYFISQTPGWPSNYAALASGVATTVSSNNLDGVDFDIEDPQPSYASPQQFAADLITFLQQVRSLLPGKIISITIPAQGWNTYWYYLATGAAAIPGLVDYISFMEYDIWVNGSLTYAQQIEADIITYISSPDTAPGPNYSKGWGIPAGMVQLGLMPGCDDNGLYLSLADSNALATRAVSLGLYGVMTWDLDRDSGNANTPKCSTYPTGYQYTKGIRNAIAAPLSVNSESFTPFLSKKRQRTSQQFIQQAPPQHGSPN